MSDWDEREVGALWKKESKAGKKYYFGNLTIEGKKINIVGYANEKKSENQPDVRLYLEKPKQG